jgi:hypothetical protein
MTPPKAGWGRPADKDGTGLPGPDRLSFRAPDIANAVLFLATTSFATGATSSMLRLPGALWKTSLAANHRISLDLDLGVRNRQRSNGD